MKAKDLAALLLRHPDLEVTFQSQRLLQPIVGVVQYLSTSIGGDEHWVGPPPEAMQLKLMEKGVEVQPKMVLALYTYLDRQFGSEAKAVIST